MFFPKAGLVGAILAILAILMIVGILSFLATTPEAWVSDLGTERGKEAGRQGYRDFGRVSILLSESGYIGAFHRKNVCILPFGCVFL